MKIPVIYAGLKERKREMMKKSATAKKPVKKYNVGGFTANGVNPAAQAAEKQQSQARAQNALDMAQSRQQQQMAASDPRARATAGRARTQTMMAKGGAVKGKKK